MKVMHGDPNRAEHQKVFVETADGKFKYQSVSYTHLTLPTNRLV